MSALQPVPIGQPISQRALGKALSNGPNKNRTQ